jgi:hypothetical protein
MDCKHYWSIDAPDGPESVGTCRLCGSKKVFINSLANPDKGTKETRDPYGHIRARRGAG